MVEEVGDGVWVVRAGTIVANSYILDVGSGQVALVDAGMDPVAIEAALATLGKRPIALLCTHGHFDHVAGARHFVDRHGIDAYLHHADNRIARGNNALLMLMGRRERISLPAFRRADNDLIVEVGDGRIEFRHTPGHTPGSCMLLWRNHLFVGDTMYAHGMGLAQRPNEDLAGIRKSIRSMWPVILDSRVHPGHGPSEDGRLVARRNTSLRAFLSEGDA